MGGMGPYSYDTVVHNNAIEIQIVPKVFKISKHQLIMLTFI